MTSRPGQSFENYKKAQARPFQAHIVNKGKWATHPLTYVERKIAHHTRHGEPMEIGELGAATPKWMKPHREEEERRQSWHLRRLRELQAA